MDTPACATLRTRFDGDIAYLQIHRPQANNTINEQLIREFTAALDVCDTRCKIVVIEGLPEVFCFGADFKELEQSSEGGESRQQDPRPMYALWGRLATGPFVSIAHVRGKANAGGIGFVAACDIVLADAAAVFSLSELLFGLMPACVLPFLIRRIGFAKANYMTLMTQPVTVQQAQEWGLVDAYEENSDNLLRKNLLRLRRLNKTGVARYKRYLHAIDGSIDAAEDAAITANREVFADSQNLQRIARYVRTGQFPWEGDS
ncbi:enoyl-CoA hydratase/isomerase [Steroidobacter sp. S1-65]|uniref:Enoyl-CoA hydratase/isomerase n=1 Tax=Steroidobacter gossypii TaxID=2805490 RepID=A0ABS1WUD5_9GAMM|nr:enoyl-CoA hydratase/isomerase [Steroidobacter gossypii]MBM0104583.1 enoyl-CoA hydratase/isomerase [Steroidobacter gossypii]